MNRFDKVVICLIGFCVVSAILTLVSYLLFELFGIGPSYLSVIFFYCAMLSALMLMFMFIGIMILKKPCS